MKIVLNQKSLRAVALEMTSIIAAVLIALWVNQWHQDRTNLQNARKALENITAELKENARILTRAHKNNLTIIENLDNPNHSGEFLPALNLQQTAWQTTLSTGTAEHIDYDNLFRLSKVYELQAMYKSFTYDLVHTMMRTNALAISLNPQIHTDDDIPTKAYDEYFILVVKVEKGLLDGTSIAYEQLKEAGFDKAVAQRSAQ